MPLLLLTLLWPPPSLTLLDRTVSQNGGTWVVQYRVEYYGPPRRLDIPTLELTGIYSNSSVPGHSVPIQRSCVGTFPSVIRVAHNCREILNIDVSRDVAVPGCRFTVVLEFRHEHALYDRYDALLGSRSLQIHLATGVSLVDELVLDDGETQLNELKITMQHLAQHTDHTMVRNGTRGILAIWTEEEGFQFMRFDDMPVRPGTPIRVSFWYWIGRGNQAECRARLTQYQDRKNGWYHEPDGFEVDLSAKPTSHGVWLYFERDIITSMGANVIAIDFRLLGQDLGAMWIDDVSIQYRPFNLTSFTRQLRHQQ